MRKVFYFMAITALVLISGCKEKEEANIPDPEITLSSTEDIVVSYEGGIATVAYEITNPVDGGKISAAASESWISNFNYDTANKVSFEVEANTVTEERSATITLTYTYSDGKTVDAVANLVQNAYVESPDPVLNISESEITVKAEGGQSEISIEIVNPAENGEIKATAAANWVTVTSATTTAIILDVDENTDTESRETTVTVTYTYGEGETIENTITVNQEARVPDPELSIPQTAITVPADGGETEVAIEILNPAENGQVVAVSNVSWITVPATSTSSVTIKVDANAEPSTREGVVTVSYIYGDGTTINAEFTVTQEAAQPSYDYDFVMTSANGSYYPNYNYNSLITFADSDGLNLYDLDFYSDGPNNNLPTAGTYNYSDFESKTMTFSWRYSKYYNYIDYTSARFSGGSVEISYEGDNMIAEGFLTDENGKTHHFIYNGPKPTLNVW